MLEGMGRVAGVFDLLPTPLCPPHCCEHKGSKSAPSTNTPLLLLTVQVLDGHHQHHIAQLACDKVPHAFLEAAGQHEDLAKALVSCLFLLLLCLSLPLSFLAW